MSHYLLFCGHCEHPCGGADDLMFRGDTIEECRAYAIKNAEEVSCPINYWYHITTSYTLSMVERGHVDENGQWNLDWSLED